MHRLTIKYARNGALAGIGLYLMIAIPLLTLSMSYAAQEKHAVTAPSQAMQQIAKAAITLLQS